MALPVHFRAGQNGRLHFAALRPHFRAAPLQTTYILHSCTDLYHHTSQPVPLRGPWSPSTRDPSLPVLTQRRGSFTLGAPAAFPACGCSCRSAESTRSRIGGVSDSPSFACRTRTHQFQKTLHVHCTLGAQDLHPSMQSRLLVGTAPWMQLWTRREIGS